MIITNEQAVVLTVGGVIVQAALYTITVLRAWKQRQSEKARYAAECEAHSLRGKLALAEAEAAALRVDRDEAESLVCEVQEQYEESMAGEKAAAQLADRLRDDRDEWKLLWKEVSDRAKTAEGAVEILRAELTKSNEEIETLRAAVKQSSAWWATPQPVQPYFQWKCPTCGVSTLTGQHHLCFGSGAWTGTITTSSIGLNDYSSTDTGSTRKTCLCLGACDCKPPSKPNSLPQPKESF